MDGVGDGSMSSPPKIEYLPATENDDGSMSVDISSLPISENPDTISASVDNVARFCRRKNKELRVKVPLECFNFIRPLSQMGFNRIEHAESTYIILREDKSCTILCANDLHETALGVTLMQRKNIASSSQPCNLICNQTPDVILPVQTPSETICEQGPEFQQSSWAFPCGPTSTGNDNEAAELQGFSAGLEIPRCGVQTKKRPHPAASKSELPSTRSRGPDFEPEEKSLVLQFKLEYLKNPDNEGKTHKWSTTVSDNMKEKGYNRDPKAVQGQWDTLKKSCDALRRKFPLDDGYWDMKEGEKKAYKKDHDRQFPLIFEFEWVATIQEIKKMKSRSGAQKETQRGRQGVFSQSLATTITGSVNFPGTGSSDANIQASVQHFGEASAQGSDEHLLENPQRHRALPSCTQDLSFLHSQREKDNQEISTTNEEQLATLQELARISNLDSSGFGNDVDYIKLFLAE